MTEQEKKERDLAYLLASLKRDTALLVLRTDGAARERAERAYGHVVGAAREAGIDVYDVDLG